MNFLKKLKYSKYVRNPASIPDNLKKALANHPQKKAIDFLAVSTILDKIDFAPFTTALKKCVEETGLNVLDRKSLRNLVKILQRGKGYSKRTRKAIDNEIPALIERFCRKEQTKEDLKDVRELQQFVLGLMAQEKTEILKKKKFF